MNCKQGDLAVIVRSSAGNEGRVLTCLRLASQEECANDGVIWWLELEGPVWLTDASLRTSTKGQTRLYPDARLRPLRDSDSDSDGEMLRIAGRPRELEKS